MSSTREYLARIEITLKAGVNDPQGITVKGALHSLGFDRVEDVRIGKYMEVRLSAPDSDEAGRRVDEMCRKLLANPVIEDYTYAVEEAAIR